MIAQVLYQFDRRINNCKARAMDIALALRHERSEQVKRHYKDKLNRANYHTELAHMDKLLFLHTKDLTLDDWRIIRGEEFWQRSDGRPSELAKKQYLLNCVIEYLKKEDEPNVYKKPTIPTKRIQD